MNKPSYILKRHQDFLDKKINLEQVHKEYEQKISEIKDANCIITDCFDVNHPVNITDNPLSGSIYTLKDNVVTKGIRTTGASKFLDNFIPPYDATLYSLLKQSGAILTSKCNLDQFGMAGTGTYSDYGIVKNVHDQTRITGGSSSGSVNLVAAKAVDFAIGSDTGDSIRRPAAFAGVVGYKPTYGLISRYGVLPYSPSLDHLGIITNSVIDAALVADQICQFDPKDYTSQKLDHEFFKNLKIQKNLKIAVIKGIENDIQENERKIYLNTLD
ncbi:MAG: hypothetical protein K2M43_03690, partial [Mycoplasmoidaceae bacterium]|nr:hypothetical protein [Mycoplasmoidaceae bacterium]